MKNTQAFTLIELLVVVLIIGILAAVALPKYQVAVYKSRYSTLKNLTKSIADAREIYYLANGNYPTTCDELSIEMPAGESWGSCTCSGRYTYCHNTKIGMGYRIYGNNQPSGYAAEAGARMCLARNQDLNSVQNQICKQETYNGNHDFTGSSETWWSYSR